MIESTPYKQIIPALATGAGLSETVFPKTVLATKYTLQTKRWLDGSFMNPNALFELFGEYSNQTGLQVRKMMLKYLGITKKKGAETSNSLKNAWIALHMQNLTARSWADGMFSRDTPGDEIALFILSRMYNRHSMVITSANIWSTVESQTPLTEEELFNLCDIRLLYIEPGVFGELRPRPAMPPAPSNQAFFESATVILSNTDTTQRDSTSPPLNLTSKATTDPVHVTDVTDDNDTALVLPTITIPEDPYIDAPLSGALDRFQNELDLNITLSGLMNRLLPQDAGCDIQDVMQNQETPPEFPRFTENVENQSSARTPVKPIMLKCMVKLHQLSEADIKRWQPPQPPQGPPDGYNLRKKETPKPASRFDRRAKSGISYVTLSSPSQDESEDFEVKPGRWSKPRTKNLHLPLSGPSKARLAAHRMMQTQREQTAAEALLNLNPNLATGDNDGTPSVPSSPSSGSKSSSAISIDESTSSSGMTSTDSNSDSSKDQQSVKESDQSINSDEPESPDDDTPLSEVKQKITAEELEGQKPYFKTKSFALYKYKRSRIFKCIDCTFTGKSQKEMNTHYRETHGKLTCPKCDNEFNTISALRKHEYEHTDRARKHPCDDCEKAFPFSSMLKSHRKVHLTALEHHCLHCEKSYKSSGELVKHQNVHSNKTWYCKENGCGYYCHDPRNLRAHMFNHKTDLRYQCSNCNKSFKWYEQLKCHRVKGCT